jgi:hypothetical protein
MATTAVPADAPPISPEVTALTTPANRDLLDPEVVSPEIPTSIVRWTAALTLVCIVFALALCAFVIYGAMQGRSSELMIRLLMSCIACFVGLAFASLGFGLFLLRARGGFRARVERGDGTPAPALLESTAPGLVVVVCATIILWLALRVRFEITSTGDGAKSSRFNYVTPPDTSAPDESALVPDHTTDGVPPP